MALRRPVADTHRRFAGDTIWRTCPYLARRLQDRYPPLVLVDAPVHASWLNQVEIYISIVQRKVLSPNDFPNLDALAERLLDFQYYWETAAPPFEWKFTRQDLAKLLTKLANQPSKQRPETTRPYL